MITKQDVFINYKIYLFIICEKKIQKNLLPFFGLFINDFNAWEMWVKTIGQFEEGFSNHCSLDGLLTPFGWYFLWHEKWLIVNQYYLHVTTLKDYKQHKIKNLVKKSLLEQNFYYWNFDRIADEYLSILLV